MRRRLAAIVDRLWRCTERRKRIDGCPFADLRYARDVNLPDEAHAGLAKLPPLTSRYNCVMTAVDPEASPSAMKAAFASVSCVVRWSRFGVFQLNVGTDDTIRADLDGVPNAGTVSEARRCINRHKSPIRPRPGIDIIDVVRRAEDPAT